MTLIKTQKPLLILGIAALASGISLFAREPIPLLGNPPHRLVMKSGGDVIAHIMLTNRARVSVPTGKFQVVEDKKRQALLYRGDGPLTVELTSERGHSTKLVAEDIEFLW